MRVVLRGRSAEMTSAFGLLRRARHAGQGGLLLVTGEPGIGKSALLATVAAEATTLGFRVGASATDPALAETAMAPLLLALRSGPDPLLSAAELAELSELALAARALTALDRLVSSGYTNRATASQLGLSPNTVGTHVRSIFSKLHVQSRVQLANSRHEARSPARSAQPPARILRAVCAISALVKA